MTATISCAGIDFFMIPYLILKVVATFRVDGLLKDFLNAYNFARTLKTLGGLPPPLNTSAKSGHPSQIVLM